jgi:hypothetical protein
LQSYVRNIHCSVSPEDIKTEIGKLEQTNSNIWSAKEYRAELLSLSSL